MRNTVLTIAAFMIISFGVQGLSHFVINVDHFAGISFMRPEPILPIGVVGYAGTGVDPRGCHATPLARRCNYP